MLSESVLDRRIHLLVGMLVLAGCWTVCGPLTPAFAQEEPPAEEVEAEAPTEEAPAAAPATTDDEPEPRESLLSWMIRASGIFGVVLLLLSFVMVAVIMMNILQVRRENLVPAAFVESFEQRLAAKDYQGAYELARQDDSMLANVLTAGLGKLNRGYSEAVEAMQEVGEEEAMAMEHKLSYLALIGSVAPMVGLMGTVYGMIISFQEIATAAVQPKPKDLADGIATALFTTLEGLTVAIPAIVAYSLLRNRVARYVLEVGTVSEALMSRFSSVGKQPGATKPAAPSAAAADQTSTE